MSLWTKIGILGSVLAVGIGLWFGDATKVTAAVTTAYVIVVFFQLDVMKRQYASEQAKRREMIRREEDRRPRLVLSEMCVRRTTEYDNVQRVDLGAAWYVNCSVKNVGGALANHAQAVLTGAAERLPDHRWRPYPDWIPLGLRWCLDEMNAIQGVPTQERYLVPNRPYLFDLGKLSTYHPDARFDLCTLLKPNAQANDFGVGEYCFEVTVYSENAEPTSSWYLVHVDRDVNAQSPLRVEQLSAAPWRVPTLPVAPSVTSAAQP